MEPTQTHTPLPTYSRRAGELARGLDEEWILTDGLGGFAMGTVSGIPTRRYHALLVASMSPPVERAVLLQGVSDVITTEPGTGREREFRLSQFHFADHDDRPTRHTFLASFDATPSFVRWVFEIPSATSMIRVVKTLHRLWRRPACVLRYSIDAPVRAKLTIEPLLAMRDFHELRTRGDGDPFDTRTTKGGTMTVHEHLGLSLEPIGAKYVEQARWWEGLYYAGEDDRGLECVEDLFAPGAFVAEVPPGSSKSVELHASADAIGPNEQSESVAQNESARADHLARVVSGTIERAPKADPKTIARFACASDAYVVQRGGSSLDIDGKPGVSVIAGYPWFSDWGRDTMICIPGLLLTTGRHEEALRVLSTFAAARRDGIIPNRFDDFGGDPHYNTVDASLWFLHASCEYARTTGDDAGFEQHLLPACLDVIDAYSKGTKYDIHTDTDGLVSAGNEQTQLTWMDAQRDGVTFTPRHGKAVEINALWINGLRSVSERAPAKKLDELAERASESFNASFWNEQAQCLYDVLVPDGKEWVPDPAIRPNQLFAASLPHSPLDTTRKRAVVDVAKRELLTPMGLRTLAPGDKEYKGRFEGPIFERDSAYHQGTVWPWLIGPYCEALLRAHDFSDAARKEAMDALRPLISEIDGPTLGQLWEVYDGDGTPQRPRKQGGCIAQAWSVAEVLRVLALLGC